MNIIKDLQIIFSNSNKLSKHQKYSIFKDIQYFLIRNLFIIRDIDKIIQIYIYVAKKLSYTIRVFVHLDSHHLYKMAPNNPLKHHLSCMVKIHLRI